MTQRALLRVTPQGNLLLEEVTDDAAGESIADELAAGLLPAFAHGAGHGLWYLGSRQVESALPPVLAWWRDLGRRFVTTLCTRGEQALSQAVPAPDLGSAQSWLWAAPPMAGAEYLTPEHLLDLWAAIDDAFRAELAQSADQPSLEAFLHALHPAWNLVGRVHLHVAENRQDAVAPFALLATYTSQLSAAGTAQHVPLGQALNDYAAAADKQRLLALLQPLQRAAAHCPWLDQLISSREIFHPLRWSAAEAMTLLRDVPHLEQAGVVVRLPAAWRGGRPARVQVSATVGGAAPSRVGQDALLDFQSALVIDGEPLSDAERQQLLSGSETLVFIRGRWVEIDRERVAATLERFQEIERLAHKQGIAFHEAMRLLAGVGRTLSDEHSVDADWSQVSAGPWLADTLRALRQRDDQRADGGEDIPGLRAVLRPYQLRGVRWLSLLSGLGLGGCLADDMGLGKTIQVLALLSLRAQHEGRAPSLLVAPASLLSNWAAEAARFTPDLKVCIAHPSALSAAALKSLQPKQLSQYDVVIVSYAALHRYPWLQTMQWRLAVLDEAQAIKNPGTRQTKAAKKLHAASRLALTGTPVENRLGDLWSLFDFVNPGLLGKAKEFSAWAQRLAGTPHGYAPLRRLIQPYLLRRLKTDQSVISDLPDKVECSAWCGLSRKQAALYQQAVEDLQKRLAESEGMARRGLVLAFLMRFKQICNHPSQWLGDQSWQESDSGKFARLRELCDTIHAKQEKVLVFSQFRETTAPLAAFLAGIFGQQGLILTGETPVKARKDLVRRFQEDERCPFFVLSLKAGGSGLNLTAASHVIHFDRWWNPAVENQATDRAFRIGQTRKVLVHKFTCRGTIEEKIDVMIQDKRRLAADLLEGSGEINLTEMSDEQLLDMVRLDLSAASTQEA
ncbi:MAG: DEAD/DEAH box helicase [Planctomycetota bacterium]|nr:MAG: DEAD/DEAH box helicase [Planctomycetota bacterium]